MYAQTSKSPFEAVMCRVGAASQNILSSNIELLLLIEDHLDICRNFKTKKCVEVQSKHENNETLQHAYDPGATPSLCK